MSKKMRNVALLGGAALLASKMLGGRKKDSDRKESKEDRERDARQEALAGPLRQMASEPKSAPKPKAKDTPKPKAEAPGVSIDEGRTAMGLPREARGRGTGVMEGATASGMPREARGVSAMEGATASGMPREARGVRRGDVPGSQVFAQINADRSARQRRAAEEERFMSGRKAGGAVKMKSGGSVGKASKRADGIATKGKTRCKIV